MAIRERRRRFASRVAPLPRGISRRMNRHSPLDREATQTGRRSSPSGVIALISVVGATASAASRAASATAGVEAAAPNEVSSPPVAVGGTHACALPGDGTVKCWGLNYYGELGDGNQDRPQCPSRRRLPTRTVTVVAGPGSTSALDGCQRYRRRLRAHLCSAHRRHRQVLGEPTRPSPGDLFAAARSGGAARRRHHDRPLGPGDGHRRARQHQPPVGRHRHHSRQRPHLRSARRQHGQVLGRCSAGQRLAPVTVMADASSPLSNVAGYHAGDVHACALMTDGSVKCWGFNGQGQLGGRRGAPPAALPVSVTMAGVPPSPCRVSPPSRPGNGCRSAQNGIFIGHTGALGADGTVACWGANDVSQLGNGNVSYLDGRPWAGNVIAAAGTTDDLAGVRRSRPELLSPAR